jgi:hypothetical protein
MFKFRVSQFKTGAAIAVASASTIVLSSAAPAHALSFSVEPVGVTTQPTWGGLTNTIIDFSIVPTGGDAAVLGTSNLIGSLTNGNVTIDKAAAGGSAIYTSVNPIVPGTPPDGNRYLAVGSSNPGGPVTNPGGEVTLNFDAPKGLGYFGFFWGSPSISDQLTFTLRNPDGTAGGTQVFTAANIFGSLPGYTYNPTSTSNAGRYVNFFVTSADPRVVASVLLQDRDLSNARSFEIDNIAYHQIPTPALLPGLVGLGFGILKKKRKQEAMVAV